MAKQLRFDKIMGNSRHIQSDKLRSSTWAVSVQGVSDQFFSGSRLTIDKHRDIGVRQPANSAKNFLHGRRLTDNFLSWRLFNGFKF